MSDSFMKEAISEARKGIHDNDGGPFGAVVVKDDVIIGRGHNTVLRDHDSTCHGEMNAIRDAEKNLGSHDLSGCVIYTTGEPCTMCLAACLWANVEKVYYGCTIADNASIGFRDETIDGSFGTRESFSDYLMQIDREECLELFGEYRKLDRERY